MRTVNPITAYEVGPTTIFTRFIARMRKDATVSATPPENVPAESPSEVAEFLHPVDKYVPDVKGRREAARAQAAGPAARPQTAGPQITEQPFQKMSSYVSSFGPGNYADYYISFLPLFWYGYGYAPLSWRFAPTPVEFQRPLSFTTTRIEFPPQKATPPISRSTVPLLPSAPTTSSVAAPPPRATVPTETVSPKPLAVAAGTPTPEAFHSEPRAAQPAPEKAQIEQKIQPQNSLIVSTRSAPQANAEIPSQQAGVQTIQPAAAKAQVASAPSSPPQKVPETTPSVRPHSPAVPAQPLSQPAPAEFVFAPHGVSPAHIVQQPLQAAPSVPALGPIVRSAAPAQATPTQKAQAAKAKSAPPQAERARPPRIAQRAEPAPAPVFFPKAVVVSKGIPQALTVQAVLERPLPPTWRETQSTIEFVRQISKPVVHLIPIQKPPAPSSPVPETFKPHAALPEAEPELIPKTAAQKTKAIEKPPMPAPKKAQEPVRQKEQAPVLEIRSAAEESRPAVVSEQTRWTPIRLSPKTPENPLPQKPRVIREPVGEPEPLRAAPQKTPSAPKHIGPEVHLEPLHRAPHGEETATPSLPHANQIGEEHAPLHEIFAQIQSYAQVFIPASRSEMPVLTPKPHAVPETVAQNPAPPPVVQSEPEVSLPPPVAASPSAPNPAEPPAPSLSSAAPQARLLFPVSVQQPPGALSPSLSKPPSVAPPPPQHREVLIERLGEETEPVYASLKPAEELPGAKELPQHPSASTGQYVPPFVHWFFANPGHFPEQLFDQNRFLDQMEIARQISFIDEERPSPRGYSGQLSFGQAVAQLSLPEALVYIEYFANRLPKNSFNGCLEVKQLDPLVLGFSIQENAKVLQQWEITFDPLNLVSEIFKDGQKIGHVHYVLDASGKLQEIRGQYENQRLVLDPQWHQRIDQKAEIEYLTFGSGRHEIVAADHLSHEIWTSEMAMERPRLYGENNRLILTTKHVILGPYEARVKLIFCRDFVTPIGGQMAFHYRSKKKGKIRAVI